MTDWRDDEADDAQFDKGFDKFIKERNIQVFKKGDPPRDIAREQAEPDVSG